LEKKIKRGSDVKKNQVISVVKTFSGFTTALGLSLVGKEMTREEVSQEVQKKHPNLNVFVDPAVVQIYEKVSSTGRGILIASVFGTGPDWTSER
jgi:short-subunit dehydrogenase involved in D-alanine esterification of teichoic acids